MSAVSASAFVGGVIILVFMEIFVDVGFVSGAESRLGFNAVIGVSCYLQC